MPPILIAFFILIGATTGPPLVKGLITPPDPTSRPKLGKPAPVEYRTWASRPWVAVSDERTRTCEVVFFALSTARHPVRLVAGGREQLLDTSWTFPRVLREGERHTLALEFRDPQGGGQLSCQEQTVSCYSSRAVMAQESEVREGQCSAAPRVQERKGGKPRLTGHAPPFVMLDPGLGGAYVDVTFEVTGTVTEDWYCPALEVTWPDDTRTFRESDCPPFPGDPDQRFRWTLNHGFPGGTWKAKACLSKAGHQLACHEVTVRVLGDQASSGFMGDPLNRP